MNDLAKRRDKKEQRRLDLIEQRRRLLEEINEQNVKAEAKRQAKRDAKKGKK